MSIYIEDRFVIVTRWDHGTVVVAGVRVGHW